MYPTISKLKYLGKTFRAGAKSVWLSADFVSTVSYLILDLLLSDTICKCMGLVAIRTTVRLKENT